MTPEISEFSYGFALTNELVGWLPISAAPIFPSLIEEGRAGGGYDVRLDMPGVPLYLQFKRAERMTRRSAKEIARSGAGLGIPFYRFHITEAGKSDQHELLRALDDGGNLVFTRCLAFIGSMKLIRHGFRTTSRLVQFLWPQLKSVDWIAKAIRSPMTGHPPGFVPMLAGWRLCPQNSSWKS